MMRRMGFVLIALSLVGTYSARAFAYPDKPIKAIICYETGSSTDIAGRSFFQHLEKLLGQPVMVINKPGAASALGLREAINMKPDGYSLGLTCSVNVLKIQGLLPYDHHDFDVLGIPSITWSVLAVSSKSPFQSTRELVEFSKANPGKVRFSTTAKGAVYWIQTNYFQRIAGAKFNIVSNPGGASYIATQLGGGHADAGIASYKALQSQIDAGNIRVLGVTTEKRVPGFEKFPTLKEQGYNMVIASWAAHVAPKGLPQDVYGKLTEAYRKAAQSKEWQDWCAQKGSIPTPEYIGKGGIQFLDSDAERQKPILETIKKR